MLNYLHSALNIVWNVQTEIVRVAEDDTIAVLQHDVSLRGTLLTVDICNRLGKGMHDDAALVARDRGMLC